MYTPRMLFSLLFLKICLLVLSLYTLARLVTLSCKKMSNLLSYASTVIIEPKGKVWSVYIHKVNRIMCFRDMAVGIFQNGGRIQLEIAPFDMPSRKPHPRTKHEVDQMTHCRVIVGRSSIFILLTLISYTPLSLRYRSLIKPLSYVIFTYFLIPLFFTQNV